MDEKSNQTPPAQQSSPAGDPIQARISELYSKHDTIPPQAKAKESLLQKFWRLHGDHPDQTAAWEAFYAQLPPDDQQALWNEYHQNQFSAADASPSTESTDQPETHDYRVDGAADEPVSHDTDRPANPSGAPGTTAEDAPGLVEPGGAGPKQPSVIAQKRKKIYQTFAIPGMVEELPATPVASPEPTATQTNEIVDKEQLFKEPQESATNNTTEQSVSGSILAKLAIAKNFVAAFIKNHAGPLTSGLIVVGLLLALNYNQFAIAKVKKYVSPGSSISSPIIIDPNTAIDIGDENKIIIPKINVDVPVVYDIDSFLDKDVQVGLERGVVHYGTTPKPGEPGNNVIVGHSSSNFFNSGQYKFAFVLLDRLELNDTFILHYEGVRYVYRVNLKKVIQPDDFSLVQPTDKPTTTLITCSPPGTNWQRLVIQAEQISPDPAMTPAPASTLTETQDANIVPGNSPSLWQRFTDWVF